MQKSTGDLAIPVELLGLSDIQIDSIDLKRRRIYIQVSSTRESVNCGQPTEPHGYGRLLSLRHLPILDHEVYIEITPRRGICKNCDDHPTTTETLELVSPQWASHPTV